MHKQSMQKRGHRPGDTDQQVTRVMSHVYYVGGSCQMSILLEGHVRCLLHWRRNNVSLHVGHYLLIFMQYCSPTAIIHKRDCKIILKITAYLVCCKGSVQSFS